MLSHYDSMKHQCQQYLNKPVKLKVNGQYDYQGIIEHVDDQNVYIIMPIDDTGQQFGLNPNSTLDQQLHSSHSDAYYQFPQPTLARGNDERFAYPGYYPYPTFQPYPFYPPYPYGYFPPRPRGWGRFILPLAALTAIAAL